MGKDEHKLKLVIEGSFDFINQEFDPKNYVLLSACMDALSAMCSKGNNERLS
jgi:hypothetical protein